MKSIKNIKWLNIYRIPVILGLIIPAVGLLGGCGKKAPPQQIPPRSVKTAKAVSRDVPLTVSSFGNLVSPFNVDIQSQVTGKITEVHFTEGGMVSKGDLLFSIDPAEYRAAVDQNRAALAGAKADLKLKEETFKRNQQLIKDKLISQQDYDTYRTEVDAARAQVEFDQAALKASEINLGYCSIASPVDGVTGKRLVDPGNVVAAAAGTALVNIRSLDPLYVDFPVTDTDLPRIRTRMKKDTLKVEVSPEGDENGPYPGTLQMIDNTVDSQTATVSLRAEIPNPDKRLWPGQYVTVKLTVATAENAVLVPGSAVQLGQNGQYCYVIKKDNTAELRDKIEVGQSEGDDLIIESGIKAGEEVVTFGQLGLAPGAKVTIDTGNDKTPSPPVSQHQGTKKTK